MIFSDNDKVILTRLCLQSGCVSVSLLKEVKTIYIDT